MKKNSHLKL